MPRLALRPESGELIRDFPPKPFQAEAEAAVAAQQAEYDRIHALAYAGRAFECPRYYDQPTGDYRVRFPVVEDVEAARLRLIAEHEARKVAQATPRARAYRAFVELYELGYRDELRGLSSVCQACAPTMMSQEFIEAHLSVESVIRAIRVLNTIDHSTAREAITALCDLQVPLMRAA